MPTWGDILDLHGRRSTKYPIRISDKSVWGKSLWENEMEAADIKMDVNNAYAQYATSKRLRFLCPFSCTYTSYSADET